MSDEFTSALSFVSSHRSAEVDAHLQSRAGSVGRLDGAEVVDRESFFRQAARDLFDAPVENWAQFEDRLRLSVMQAPGDEYAFVWTDVHRMLEGGLPTLVTVADICFTFARARASHGHRFRAFFIGDGPNFS